MLNRQAMLDRLRSERNWDIIIVGGGATGMGAAIDAATRGHRTLLLEATDFAQGTSSRSTKLIHGGVRYLRSGQINMVRDALHEREHLLRNAPSIVHPLRLVIPSYRRGGRWYFLAGLKTYDLLAGKTELPAAELLSSRQCVERLPNLVSDGLRGGVAFSDGQFDDARLVVAMAQLAARHGAAIVNYCPVERLLAQSGRIVGVVAQDSEQGVELELHAKVVINATGVFAADLWRMEEQSTGAGDKPPDIVPSQGTHLVLPGSFMPGDDAVLIPDTPDGRVLFLIPWQGHTLLGTTDVVVQDVDREPRPSAEEVDYLLEQSAGYLRKKPTRADVLSCFAGLRPLVGRGTRADGTAVAKSASLSREHELHVSKGKLISAIGGKWTTYRLMGEQLIDLAEKVGELPKRPCLTRTLRLDEGQTIGNGELPLHAELPVTERHISAAVQCEMARTVEDVLSRRTRALFLNARAAIELAPQVAKKMAAETGRPPEWEQSQIATFEKLAAGYVVQPLRTSAK